MPSRSTYRVGGHTFAIEYPTELLSEKELLPYAPFQTASSRFDDTLFTLRIIADPKAISESDPALISLEDENGLMKISSSPDGTLTIIMSSPEGTECCRMLLQPDFRRAEAWIGGSEGERRYALDSSLMLMYAFASAPHATLLLHASAIECHGRAFIFLGKSGTGKSTHSRLWLTHIPGAELLNDDNPIVRITDGKACVYGSPWSGKTPCHLNRHHPIGGIVRLQQSHENRMTDLTGAKAYAALLPSCSGMKWNRKIADAIHTTLSKLIGDVPVRSLECRPDKEAALLSFNILTYGQ